MERLYLKYRLRRPEESGLRACLGKGFVAVSLRLCVCVSASACVGVSLRLCPQDGSKTYLKY
jgi:hypothetical protein